MKRKEIENITPFGCHRKYTIYRKKKEKKNCLDYLNDQLNNRSYIYINEIKANILSINISKLLSMVNILFSDILYTIVD
jgi:hypothetical protein